MRNLQKLQQDFQNYLLQQDACIEKEIVDVLPVSASARLDIYRDAYYLRLQEALQHDYPVLHGLLGQDQFDQLTSDYIKQFPSHFRSIRWFGNQFTHFLQEHHYSPGLIEMTQFEWALTESFDAADRALVTVEDMAALPAEKWPTMGFTLHPSLRQLNLAWNTIAIWKAYKERKKCLSSQKLTKPADWIIWRKQREIQFCSLGVEEIYMIEAMRAGKNFSQICEGLCEWINEQQVAMQAAMLLKRFVSDNLIVEIL